ncbi:hypothetical protein G9A89_016061 [Geosiphon pyriformis]|nr:hypothetical protein G9A89_016061 [Geosiphon pyriformis]
MEKSGMIPHNSSVPVLISGFPSVLSANMVRLLDPVGASVGSSNTGLAGLRTQSSGKKKAHIDSMYFRGLLFKKPKMPIASNMVNSSAGPLSLVDIDNANVKPIVSWGSKVGSVFNSVSGFLDVKNMKNMVTEETSYAEFGKDDNMDKAMLKKTCTQTYMLNNLPKQLLFEHISDNNTELVLPASKFVEFNQLSSVKLRVLEKHSFDSVKLFTLDIELSAVSKKTNSDKLIAIKKNFYQIDGFEGISTPSKFSGIIRALFTSEFNLNKTKKLAVCEKILVNNNLRKKIPVNLPKLAVESVFSKFEKIVSIKMQLISLWQKALVKYELFKIADLVVARWFVFMRKNSVHVTKAIGNKQIWVFKDQHQALLYIFLVGIMAHDLSGLMELYGKKTCFIGCNPNSYVHDRCVTVCFADKTFKLAVIGFVLVFRGVNLHWAGLFLACCSKCKHFGHIFDVCLKQTLIVCPVSFGSKTWAQVASGFSLHVVLSFSFGTDSSSDTEISSAILAFSGDSGLHNYLASLKHSVELLSDQISGILKKLSFIELVPLVPFSLTSPSIASVSLNSGLDLNMAVNSMFMLPVPSLIGINIDVSGFSSNSSKILTTKVGSLESKMVVLDVLVNSVLERLNYLCSGLDLSTFTNPQ